MKMTGKKDEDASAEAPGTGSRKARFLRMLVSGGIITFCLLIVCDVYLPGANDVMNHLYSLGRSATIYRTNSLTTPASLPVSVTPLSSADKLFNQTLELRERNCLDFTLNGNTFTSRGENESVPGDVTCCLVHSFSPYIERQAMKSFLDPPRDNVFLANSPAILWHEGVVLLVSRIWLDKEKWRDVPDQPANNFMDNWFYTQKFDRRMKPVSTGHIMGMPTPKGGSIGDGPIEPRLFKVRGHVMMSFNAGMSFSRKEHADYTLFWNMEENKLVLPRIQGGSAVLNATANSRMPCDKHWMALVEDNQLFMVQLLDPLRVMNCTLEGSCKLIHKEPESNNTFVFHDVTSHLRGGTPFVLYEWPYYISIAHSTLFRNPSWKRFYAIHLVVLRVSPYRVVYVSHDIQVHADIYKMAPIVRTLYIVDNFVFPVGLILEDKDKLAIGVHVNDHSSMILRLKGVEDIMNKVMAQDRRIPSDTGPPTSTLHRYIHKVMQNNANSTFFHKS